MQEQQNTTKYGVKETGEVLEFLGAFATTTGDIAADGKVTLIEFLKYVNLYPVVAPAIDNVKVVSLELGDLDTAERAILKQKFGAALKVPNPITEELLEEGADLGLHIMQFVLKVKELRSQKKLA
jgi:hypothetical protein